MVSFTDSAFAAGAAMLLTVAFWAAPSPGLAAERASGAEALAQAATPQAAPAAKPARSVESRIASLHAKLKITDAQQPQWDAVAGAMRENAAAMQAAIQKRKQNAARMTAVDDLHSYQEIAGLHEDGLKRLVPAFEALYATMSDEQKKNADAVFGHRGRRSAKKNG